VTARERWRLDLQRYLDQTHYREGPLRRPRIVLMTEGLWALALYRFGQYLYREAPAVLRGLLRIPYEITRKLLTLAVGIHLSPETEIGPGLYIAHFGGIWINPRVTIGSHCNIAHNVTIGAPTSAKGAPVLGDRVWIGSGAVITGPVRIGSGVVIGANSLVTSNIPEDAVVVGVPARVLTYTGSAGLLRVGRPAPGESGR
jgi:serine O-acetyltransferase